MIIPLRFHWQRYYPGSDKPEIGRQCSLLPTRLSGFITKVGPHGMQEGLLFGVLRSKFNQMERVLVRRLKIRIQNSTGLLKFGTLFPAYPHNFQCNTCPFSPAPVLGE